MPTCALASDTLREEAATELGRLLINGDTASIKPVKLKQLIRASMTWDNLYSHCNSNPKAVDMRVHSRSDWLSDNLRFLESSNFAVGIAHFAHNLIRVLADSLIVASETMHHRSIWAARTGTSARERSTSFKCVQPKLPGKVSSTFCRNSATSCPTKRLMLATAPGHSR